MLQPSSQPMVLGKTLGYYRPRIFGMLQPDRLLHTFILGQTGTGKTTFLLNLARQDVSANRGFCLIDPHGDLAQDLRREIAGLSHIYWDVSDPDCPFGYNPLTPVSASHRPLIASGLIDTLKKQWADAWGARMEHLLRMAVLALLERPDANLEQIMMLFLDKGFRYQTVGMISNPTVRRFWTKEFPAMNYKGAVDGVAPIANKLGGFLSHPVINKALCNPNEPLRFRKMMDDGNVLIINLAKGRLGADVANIVGGLIVSNIAHAALSRENTPATDRKPFFLYVDEFASFSTAAFASMLSELRKYGLGIIAATQFTFQIEKQTFEAILGNVGTIISFRIGAFDASLIAKQFAGRLPQPPDLINLDNYEFFIKMMVNGAQTKPFSAKSMKLI